MRAVQSREAAVPGTNFRGRVSAQRAGGVGPLQMEEDLGHVHLLSAVHQE